MGCLFDFVALGWALFFRKRVLIRVWAPIQGNITFVIVFCLFHMMCGMKNPCLYPLCLCFKEYTISFIYKCVI